DARVAMAHRTGTLQIGEPSVVVSVSCPHRAEAIEACKGGIDRLEESVPIWKKEFARSGAGWREGGEARSDRRWPSRPGVGRALCRAQVVAYEALEAN